MPVGGTRARRRPLVVALIYGDVGLAAGLASSATGAAGASENMERGAGDGKGKTASDTGTLQGANGACKKLQHLPRRFRSSRMRSPSATK